MRQGLDRAALAHWLAQHEITEDEALPELTQFEGGASNLTYLLRLRDRELVLRRAPPGVHAGNAHDVVREARIMNSVKKHLPEVPTIVAQCADSSVIGSPFTIMEKIDGHIPRKSMGMELSPANATALCHSMLDALVRLHKIDVEEAGLLDIGRGAGYSKRQVDNWCRRYQKAKTWNVLPFRRVQAWLVDNAPDDVAHCLIHNDWRLDNLVLDPAQPSRILGILDWEMATVGDPLMELGSALAYWIHDDDPYFLRKARRQPSHLPGMLRREEMVAYYAESAGVEVHNWSFYEAFGLFRLAGIAQQIYARYQRKDTRNRAFRHFWTYVNYLGYRAGKVIQGR